MLKPTICLCALLATACSGVSVQRLDSTLDAPAGAEGLIYYLPAPYLIVAELPPTQPGANKGDGTGGNVKHPNADSAEQPNADKDVGASSPDATSDAKGSASASTSPGSSTNTSFTASTPQYVMRIVYLPDETRPMAIREQRGFGSADMKPVLQDGWMLVSLDAPVDNSQILTAITTLVGSAIGASTGASATKALPKFQRGQTSPPPLIDLSGLFEPGHFILRPGLYRFVYKNGTLTGLEAVSYFTGCGAVSPAQLEIILQAAISGKAGECPHLPPDAPK